MAPLIAGRSVQPRDASCWHYPHYHGSGETPGSAIRVGDLKLVRHCESGLRRAELVELVKVGLDSLARLNYMVEFAQVDVGEESGDRIVGGESAPGQS